MNEYDKRNMLGTDIRSCVCPFCGKPAQNAHHIVPRSRGGKNSPLVNVCGMGNTSGCHGLLHDHKLHLRWANGRWEYLRTAEPTKQHVTEEMQGWKELRWTSDTYQSF